MQANGVEHDYFFWLLTRLWPIGRSRWLRDHFACRFRKDVSTRSSLTLSWAPV
jgi:hypothetical protein